MQDWVTASKLAAARRWLARVQGWGGARTVWSWGPSAWGGWSFPATAGAQRLAMPERGFTRYPWPR